jgi:DNA polymerase
MLLNTNDSLTKLREKVQHYRGVPMIVTYHPAALLRNPNWKRPTWEDMKLLRKMYNELSITNG